MPITRLILIITFALVAYSASAKNLYLRRPVVGLSTLLTTELQQGIDQVAQSGGGKLTVGPGVWLTGTLMLKSNFELHLAPGCTLLGSTDTSHYLTLTTPYRSLWSNVGYKQILYGTDLVNIRITGQGCIDGQGDHPNFAFNPDRQGTRWKDGNAANRPLLLRLVNCKRVLVQDISLRQPAFWTQLYQHCSNVIVERINVWSFANRNNDGIDIDNCSNMIVKNCVINSEDDGICLKSNSRADMCQNIIIVDNKVSSTCNALKLGTASLGGFKNIYFKNNAVLPPPLRNVHYDRECGLAAIALEIVDGGKLKNVLVSNSDIDGYMTPIFIKLGNRGKKIDEDPKADIGDIDGITISNIKARCQRLYSSSITGIVGKKVRNITLSNIEIEAPGNGFLSHFNRVIPENEDRYPENLMFGPLPAAGLYVRHAENVRVSVFKLINRQPDSRPGIVIDNTHNSQFVQLQLPKADSVGTSTHQVRSSNVLFK